jgi:transcriptional regulator with XRE-family HTH domain
MDKLRAYIREVMKQQGLSVAEIARRSGDKITDSYIFDILSGKTKSIGVEKINALAEGLGVESVELFKIASGHKPSPDPTGELTAILKIIIGMTAKERTALLAYLKKK